MEGSPKPIVNRYIKHYAGRLAGTDLVLKDPNTPELGYRLVPAEERLGRMSLTDGVPIVTEAPEPERTYGVGWPE